MSIKVIFTSVKKQYDEANITNELCLD